MDGNGGTGSVSRNNGRRGVNANGGAGGTGSYNIGYINQGTYESYYSNN